MRVSKPHPSDRVVLARSCDIPPVVVEWLWPGWLARGKVHLLAGAPASGKSTIALSLAAIVSAGGHWPDGTVATAGNVVLWSGEDDCADTVVPRLLAAGAQMDRLRLVKGVEFLGQSRSFDPATDMQALEKELRSIHDVRLLVIDPVVAAVAADSHKNTEVRRALQPLVDLAQSLNCAVVGITHLTKGTAGRDPVERVTGSLAFGALARMVLIAAKPTADSEDESHRILVRAKSNLGREGGGFTYVLGEKEVPGYPSMTATVVNWGSTLHGSARCLLAQMEPNLRRDRSIELDRFLIELLAEGPVRTKDVYEAVEAAGFSIPSAKRVKKRLGIQARKPGMSEGWVWNLPTDEESEAHHIKKVIPSIPSELNVALEQEVGEI